MFTARFLDDVEAFRRRRAGLKQALLEARKAGDSGPRHLGLWGTVAAIARQVHVERDFYGWLRELLERAPLDEDPPHMPRSHRIRIQPLPNAGF